VQTASGKTISNADIAEPKLVMRMAGMADMQGEAVKMTPDAEGNYRFAANVVAPGEWVLNLTAHVQGEKDAVQGSLTFQVVK
jgi:nitrogen fixation protein FixH